MQKKALEKKEQQINDLQKQKNTLHDLLEKGVYDIETFLETTEIHCNTFKSYTRRN